MRDDGHLSTVHVAPHLGTAQSSCAVTETPKSWPLSQPKRRLLETERPGLLGGVLTCSGGPALEHRLGDFDHGMNSLSVPGL